MNRTVTRHIIGLLAVVSTCNSTPLRVMASPVSLSLSSPDDLQQVLPGQIVTIQLHLTGVTETERLSLFAATVAYDAGLFDVPLISNGDILPNPLADPLDFLTFADAGIADAIFFTFSSAPNEQIENDGLFYSFSVQAIAEGTGSFSLVFADAGLFDPENPGMPIPADLIIGEQLPFVIVVPEPTSLAMLATGIAALLLMPFARRRAQQPIKN